MNKLLLPLLALGLASLSVPAFATHPNEVCHVNLDIAAIAQKAGVSPSSVRIRYVFHTNMTDMNPPKPEIVTRPARGPWIYKADVHSSLYERRLAAVLVEGVLYKVTDGTPEWSARADRPETDDVKAAGPIRCEQYAD